MILNSPYISGSLTVTGNTNLMGALTVTGSLAGTATSSSFAYTASSAVSAYTAASAVNATTALTASYATSFTVGGTLTAQTLVVQTITSSVSFITGSTRFGSLLTNTHDFTGSVRITGSLTVNTTGTEFQVTNNGVVLGNLSADNHTITGSLNMTGSLGINAASSFRFNGIADTSHAVGYDSTVDGAFLRGQNGVRFLTGTGGGSERMRISAAGTASFTSNTLSNSADAATINLKQNSTTANTGIYLERSGEQKGYYIYMGGSVDSLTFQRNNAGTKADVMSLTRDGNVGIGITNPTFKVDISGDSSDTVKLRVRNINATGSAGLILNPEGAGAGSLGDATIFYDVNSTAWVSGVDKSDSSKFKIANDVYGDFRANNYFTVTTSGNVGINMTAPSQKLHVIGGFLQTADNSSWYRNVFERNLSTWDNIVGFTPGSSPQYTYGYINITASGYVNGTSAGGVTTSRWYYSITNNSISVSVVGTDISNGSQAPSIRLVVSSGTIYVQVQSATPAATAYTTVFVDAMLASGYINGTYWTIA